MVAKVVILVDVDAKTFSIEEEKRVFYVGASRAKHYLDIFTCLDDVSDDTKLWNPDTAPQAIVTNNVGNNKFPLTSNPLNAFKFIDGFATITPKTAPTIIAISKNVLK